MFYSDKLQSLAPLHCWWLDWWVDLNFWDGNPEPWYEELSPWWNFSINTGAWPGICLYHWAGSVLTDPRLHSMMAASPFLTVTIECFCVTTVTPPTPGNKMTKRETLRKSIPTSSLMCRMSLSLHVRAVMRVQTAPSILSLCASGLLPLKGWEEVQEMSFNTRLKLIETNRVEALKCNYLHVIICFLYDVASAKLLTPHTYAPEPGQVNRTIFHLPRTLLKMMENRTLKLLFPAFVTLF